MKLKDLAAGLGISPAMVTKLKARGMPTGSVEGAEKWRRRHLGPTRTKGQRAGSARYAPGLVGDVSKPPRASVLPTTAAQLLQVRELGLLAHDALERGTFDAVAPLLRQAMARVPHQARPQIELSPQVWDALTACIPHDLVPTPEQAQSGDFSDEFMETFWMQIALAEHSDMHLVIRPAPIVRSEGGRG